MWCFAKVNGKLAEIYFEKKRGKNEIYGHFYAKKSEYETEEEQKWIEEDTEKFNFLFKNNKYIDLNIQN
ncbi:MAG: hypothetical protein AAB778_03145 [Patescibacteria group bacterium]